MSRYNGKTETETQNLVRDKILEMLPTTLEAVETKLGYSKLLTNTALTDLLRDKKVILIPDRNETWIKKASK